MDGREPDQHPGGPHASNRAGAAAASRALASRWARHLSPALRPEEAGLSRRRVVRSGARHHDRAARVAGKVSPTVARVGACGDTWKRKDTRGRGMNAVIGFRAGKESDLPHVLDTFAREYGKTAHGKPMGEALKRKLLTTLIGSSRWT